MNEKQLSLYFEHLGLPMMFSPTLLTLNVLQSAHLAHFPFQNLSVILNEPASFNIDDIFEKLVVQQRGGHGYELNFLFAHLLQQLGFNVRLLTAKLILPDVPAHMLPYAHLLLEVNCDEIPYLVDVGYGGRCPMTPFSLLNYQPRTTPNGTFWLRQHDHLLSLDILIKENIIKRTKEWQTLYEFDLKEKLYSDWEMGNWYVSTHPHSPLRRQLQVACTTEDGYHHCLINHRYSQLHTHLPNQYEELKNARDILYLLQERFHLNVDYVDKKALQRFLDKV